jgi:D-Tyr-tRNAtyr deacylase
LREAAERGDSRAGGSSKRRAARVERLGARGRQDHREIGGGYLVLAAIMRGDDLPLGRPPVADKLAEMRVFADAEGR